MSPRKTVQTFIISLGENFQETTELLWSVSRQKMRFAISSEHAPSRLFFFFLNCSSSYVVPSFPLSPTCISSSGGIKPFKRLLKVGLSDFPLPSFPKTLLDFTYLCFPTSPKKPSLSYGMSETVERVINNCSGFS